MSNAMDIYINSYGAYIHKSGDLLELELDGEKRKISPKKVKSLIISTHVSITTDVIKLLIDNNIDIVLMDEFGNPYGRFWHSKFGSTAYIRRRQIEEFEGVNGINYAKEWIIVKIESSVNHLKKLAERRDSKVEFINENIFKIEEFIDKIEKLNGTIEEKRNTLMAYEGNASRVYYKVISELIPTAYKFNGRSMRPAKDEFNCMLNYAFGVLYGKVEKACIIAGLDPFIGVLHTDNYNKKSLVFDFIERYRYLAWETVFTMFSKKEVNKSYFDKIRGGLKLNEEGKRKLLLPFTEKLNQRVLYNGRKISNIDIIQFDAHRLANSLIEKDIEKEEEE